MSTSILYHCFGIAGRGIHHVHSRFEEGKTIFRIGKDPTTLECSQCGSWNVKREGTVKDHAKTKEELINELMAMRQRVAKLEGSLVTLKQQQDETGALDIITDTTRKVAEAALARSEERLAHILSANPAVIYTAKPYGDYGPTFISDNITAQLGYEPREFLEDPSFWASHIHPEDVQGVLGGLPLLFEQDHHAHEYRFRHKDGSYRWIRDEMNLRRDKNGTPVEITGFWLDITEPKRDEALLRESEERLSLAVQGANLGLWDWNFKTGRGSLNEGAERMLGYSIGDSEVDLRTLKSWIHPDDWPAYSEALDGHLEGRLPSFESESRFRCKSGEWKWILSRGRIMGYDADGKPLRVIGTTLDTTDRRRAEEELRIRDQAIRTSITGIVFATPEDTISFANESFLRMWGFHGPDDVVGLHVSELADDKEDFFKIFAELQEKGFYEGEVTARRRDGWPFDAQISASSILDDSGKPVCVMASFLDITDRKQAGEALRKAHDDLELTVQERTAELKTVNEELLREIAERKEAEEALKLEREQLLSIFDSINEVISVIDAETYEILYVNKLMKDRFGEGVIGGLCYKDLHGLDSPCGHCAKEIAISLRGEPYRWDYHNPTSNRDYLATDRIIKWTDGRDAKFHLGIDVTERKKAVEALQKQHEIQRTLLSAVPAYVYFKDSNSVYITGNKRFSELSGVPESEVPGKTDYDFFSQADADCFSRDDAEIIATREAKLNYEVKGTDRAGNPIWYSTSKAPFYGPSGEIAGLVGICIDITDLKRTQELLVQADRYRAVADLAGGIAHNFNNLLQIVIGNLELALLDVEMGNYTVVKDSLEKVLESSRFGVETVRRLQSFAGIRDHSQLSEEGVFDLSGIVGQSLEMSKTWWKAIPEKQGIQVSLDTELQDGCRVRGEKNQLFEVVVNLIKNATEALPQGGAIDVKTHVEGEQVVLKIGDTGIGISEENLKRIFNPFFTTKATAGSGLGLASSRNIIENCGGSILVDSSEGKGTTFTIRLPLAEQPSEETRPPIQQVSGPGRTILVIDDTEAVLDVLKAGLTRSGHVVVTASSGQQGLDIFKENPIDLVICDLGMPGINGWEVGKRIRSLCEERHIPKTPFILLTGWGGQKTEAEQIAESGVDTVVEKPISIGDILEVVRQLGEKEPSEVSQ